MKILRVSILLITILLNNSEIISQISFVKETNLTLNSFDDRYASYSPDGTKIVFESNRNGSWQIYLMNSNGSKQERLTKHKSNNRRPSWHPSGELILFESDRSDKNELYTIDIKNLQVKQLTNIEKGEPIFADYSPNGQTIAVSIQESENRSNIVLMDNGGKINKKLTNLNLRNFFPRWSNDGKDIVYFSRKETENQDDEIYRLNIKTGEEKRLTDWPKHNFCPSWSHDNSKIVYVTSMEKIRPEIYIMDSNGKNQIRITYNEDGDTLPCWSPTDSKILITGYRKGNFEICEIELSFNKE